MTDGSQPRRPHDRSDCMDAESKPVHAPRRISTRVAALVIAVVLTGTVTADVTGAAAEESFTFNGGGWGHGVGLSQYGACGMASKGSNYAQILTHYYTGTRVSGVTEPQHLRVLLADSNTFTLEVPKGSTISGIGTVSSDRKISVSRVGVKAKLTGGVNATVALPLTVARSGAMRISPPGHRFDRGHLVVSGTPESPTKLRAVIGGLATREYLLGLGEMPTSWPVEALKSQATAARTMAVVKSASSAGSDHDLKAYLDGAYIGYEVRAKTTEAYWARWVNAIDTTAGKVVTYGGKAIPSAVYSSSSGGGTENSENVWWEPTPYLRGVADSADSGCGNPRHRWNMTFTGSQLGSKLKIPTVRSIAVSGPVGVSGRTDKATVTFTDLGGARHAFTGAQLRSALGLHSTKFTISGATVATSPAPKPGATRPPSGTLGAIRAHDRRTILVAGRASDPDGTPRVFVADVVDGRTRWHAFDSAGGNFLAALPAEPGEHTTCVAVLDTPSGAATTLGCRNTVVK